MSNTKFRSAKHSIHVLVSKLNLQSHSSRADMRYMLGRCVKDLHELGYKVGHVKGIKERHVDALVNHWKTQGKNPGTIKNYMAKLRKMAHFLGEPLMIKADNSAYLIPERSYAPTINKAIHDVDFSHCQDPFLRLSLEGQALFGFRREESMKFTLSKALDRDFLNIHPGWTKGGVGRTLKIRTPEQWHWLHRVGELVKPGQSLIPSHKSYRQQLNQYKGVTQKLKLSNCHGLRHAYAQRRYIELTRSFDAKNQGLLPPIAGGKPFKTLTKKEQEWDRRARHILVRELGHSRLSIVKIYCG